jgi:Na+-translocating ferredoxin:NAD+ oxidoreductase RnfC subunit
MAKINTGNISGYEAMSAEDKIKALLEYELPEKAAEPADNTDTEKLKALLNRANSEAAEYKRQLKAKMTEQEQREAERQEAEAKMREELAALRRDKTTDGYATNLMAIGYDAETAKSMGAMLPENVPSEFFAAHKAFVEQVRKQAEAELLKKQPSLTNGVTPASATMEDQLTADLRRWAGLDK